MPEHKSRLCTREFLQEVRNGKCYVPKTNDLKAGFCPEPPSNEVVKIALIEVIEAGIATMGGPSPERDAFERLIYHLRLRPGDKNFHLTVLAHLTNGQHEFFHKDYRPPPRPSSDAFKVTFNNDDGFFDNLPPTKSKSKRSNALQTVLNAEQRYELQLALINKKN